MANWITNNIKAKGIKSLDIFTNNGIDFDKIIPEPVHKKDCPEEFLYQENNTEHCPKSTNKPWLNWCKWRNKFWGVSVNADTDNNTDITMTKDDIITFDTKWGAPYPIIAKLSRIIGDEILTHECFDIDTLYSPIFRTVWKNGRMIESYQSVFEYDLKSENSDGKYGEFTPIDIDSKY